MASAIILAAIMHHEVGHVAVGKNWFDYIFCCVRMDQVSSWKSLAKKISEWGTQPVFYYLCVRSIPFFSRFLGTAGPWIDGTDQAEKLINKLS